MNLIRVINHNGGLRKSVLVLARRDDLKIGELVGEDRLGNIYYENNQRYFLGKNRWVAYADKFGYDYDGSCVDAHWFRWLHYMTDFPPNKERGREVHKWILPHQENKTGTSEEYVPYTTTPPKILPWTPPKPSPTNK